MVSSVLPVTSTTHGTPAAGGCDIEGVTRGGNNEASVANECVQTRPDDRGVC